MKNKAITHIILDGVDGVGKSTISTRLWKKFNFKYRVYVRGELSDYVYAKKYHRPQIFTQNGLPFLHVLITADKSTVAEHLKERDKDYESELSKYDTDNQAFIDAAKSLKDNYNIIVVDISNLTIAKAVDKIYDACNYYINFLQTDDSISYWNEMYAKGCKRAGINFSVKQDQIYFDNDMIMADYWLSHNGIYEQFNRLNGCKDNLVFSLAYDKIFYSKDFDKRQIDFVYPINSKIIHRPDAKEYMRTIVSAGLTLLTTESKYTTDKERTSTFSKVFGNDYIKELAKAKATVYTSRDLADIRMMTVRVYESCLAGNIVFVDFKSDPDCEILRQIHKNNFKARNLLYCDCQSIVHRYHALLEDKALIKQVLKEQEAWYSELRKEVEICK